jgi:hypothetical protein
MYPHATATKQPLGARAAAGRACLGGVPCGNARSAGGYGRDR